MAVHIMFYSSDQYFSEMFSNTLSSQGGFSVLSYTDCDMALEDLMLGKRPIQAILADEDFLRSSEIPEQVVKICLSDATHPSIGTDNLNYLNIFQRQTDIIGDLRSILATSGIRELSRVVSSASSVGKIISFFSTEGGSGKTTLAYLTSVAAAQKGKTIYLNLEESAWTEGLYKTQSEVRAGDFLLNLKEHGNASQLLPALQRNEHGVHILPVADSFIDWQELTEEDIKFLLMGLLSVAKADFVVVDLSSGFSQQNRTVLKESALTVLVYSDTPSGTGKKQVLTSDPSYQQLPLAGRECLAGNRCNKKYCDHRYQVMIPYSKSVADGVDALAVLTGNKEINSACEQILAKAK